MSDLDLDKLDRLYAEATDGTWVPTAEKDRFSSAMFDAYPALSARLREVEQSRDEWKEAWHNLNHDTRAELEAVKRERDEWKECAAARLNVSEAIDRA